MTDAGLLRVAYTANIVILLPVCVAMARPGGVGPVFQGMVDDSAGLRLLVFSLWGAILIGSIAGLWRPAPFWPLIAMQIVYKALWLGAFVLPLLMAGKGAMVPWGITIVFALIVAIYPLLLWRAFG